MAREEITARGSRAVEHGLPQGTGPTGGLERAVRCVCARSLPSRLTLCDPGDHSLSGSSVHGTLQARTLEWVAMASSRDSGR